jgi:hypothetical protein
MSGRSTPVRAKPNAGEGRVARTERGPGLAARWSLEVRVRTLRAATAESGNQFDHCVERGL